MITRAREFNNSALPGVKILPLGQDTLKAGEPQTISVTLEPGATIPLHTHSSDARMTILSGNAIVLSDNEDNGREVGPGDCVLFAKDKPHGFEAGTEGLVFVSENGGIVDQEPQNWDIQFG
ncbi:MAG: cupin domain-containing protein [Alphaproteobacteria bacterium]|nr:cupin domain-containing protein [Alphaproteobacteria bacterium]